MTKTIKTDTSRIKLLSLITLLSGMSGITYEVLYLRMLELHFGNIFSITASILSTFLLGIAIGSVCAFKLHKYLPFFQMGIGVYAISFLPGLEFISNSSAADFLINHDIASIVFLLAIPTFLIGTSVPLFSGYLKQLAGESHSFLKVYSVYNFGSFLSILAVEFLLLRSMEISKSVSLIGGINILCGVLLLAKFSDIAKSPLETSNDSNNKLLATKSNILLFASSILSSTFQMFFASTCFLVFTPNHENFSLSIAISLFGVAISPFLVKRFDLKFFQVLLLIPVSLIVVFLAFPVVLANIDTVIMDFGIDNFLSSFIFASIIGLLPLLFYSATVPSLMRSENLVEKESGNLLFWCCLGNTAGYLVYALFIHESVSATIYLSILGILSILISVISAPEKILGGWKYLAIAEIFLLLLIPLSWNQNRLYGAPIFRYLDPSGQGKFTTYKHGTDSVTVFQNDKQQNLAYNGLLSIVFKDETGHINESETMLGVISSCFARKKEQLLVTGIGTGVTCGAFARIFANSEFVEINRAFAQFYKNFPEIHRNTFDRDNVKVIYADGRTYTQRSRKKYDMVMNNVSQPVFFGACKLFTTEFIGIAKKKLTDNGVFVTWISSGMGSEGMKSIVKSIHENFKFCAMAHYTGDSYILAASDAPLEFNIPDSLLKDQELKNDILRWAYPFSVEEFLKLKLLSANIFNSESENLISSWQPNTDQWPILEFAAKDQEDIFLHNIKKFKYSFMGNPITKKPVTENEFKCRLLDYSRHFPNGFTYLFIQANATFPDYLKNLPNWMATQIEKRKLEATDLLMSLGTLFKIVKNKELEYKTMVELCTLKPYYFESHNAAYKLAQELGLESSAAVWKYKAFLIWPFWEDESH